MEPVDPELTERLNAAADAVTATPDLDAVLVGAGRSRRRQRTIGVAGAAAVVALGVGGVVLVANRDTNELPEAQPEPVVVPLTTLAPSDDGANATADTVPVNEDTPAETVAVGSVEVEVDSSGLYPDPYQYDPNAPDPAEPYIEQSTEIYRRETPSGTDVRVLRSNVPYGELFGIEWDLPTGTQDACLGGDAIFIGSPDGPPQWLSSWTVRQWRALDPTQEIAIDEYYTATASNLIVRTDLAAREVTLTHGTEVHDRAEFIDGVAVIEMAGFGDGAFEGGETGPLLTMAVDTEDGESELRTFPVYGQYYGQQLATTGCIAPPIPGQELPEAGAEQPVDVVAAEAAVRERHAILVDRSDIEKPEDILTDDTGVTEARAQMEAGGYAESAAGAAYTIDGVVFTDAETAWFEYTIDAPSGTFGHRFGQAIYNGEVWQITRQTICQDLSLAGGYCDGDENTPNLEPPLADGVDFNQAMAEWQVLQNSFFEKLQCNPLNPCGEFDLAGQLPDPGEQPADVDIARVEVTTLMESMYGSGALLDRLDFIDDPTGVADALAQFEDSAYGDEAASAIAIVEEVVFTSPDTASFRYSVHSDAYRFDRRVGEAARIDGVWKISRATICNDLAIASAGCAIID